MSFWRTVGDIFSFGQISRNDRKKEEAHRDAAQQVWEDLSGQMPSTADLQGFGMFGGQAPDEYIGNYRLQNPNASIEDAQNAWVQDQIAQNPLFGLDVNEESALAGTYADQGSIDAQRRALQQMQGIYDAGGYTGAERAQLGMAQRDAAMGERSQRLAVQQQAAARGMGGGGMELMGALSAQQGGANRANDWANQIAVAGQQRALQALQQSGDWAGQQRGQSFDEARTRNAAADAWNQYQTGLIQQRQNAAGDATQNAFANRLNIAGAQSGQFTQAADAYQHDQDQTDATTNAAIGTIAKAYGG